MVILNSESYNTLVSLERDEKFLNGNTSEASCGAEQSEFASTNIYLPIDELDYDILPSQTIYLPSTRRVDEYLLNVPDIIEGCDQFLAQEPLVLDDSCTQRILYVGQGEAAHATFSQCDILVTDRATTCHMIALRSESEDSSPLVSMAHIDATTPESCIRAMVMEHLIHHQMGIQEEKKNDDYETFDNRISLKVHVVGGFEDQEGASSKITSWLFNLLAKLASEFLDSMMMILETCAVSSLNDNGYSCPIARSLAINAQTGEVFRATVADSLLGPVPELRAARVWAGEMALSIIHKSSSTKIEIQPFPYSKIPEMQKLLQLPDHLLLQFTSTSPDVEHFDFCQSVRASLKFILRVPCSKAFPNGESLIFRRSSLSNNNVWEVTDR